MHVLFLLILRKAEGEASLFFGSMSNIMNTMMNILTAFIYWVENR